MEGAHRAASDPREPSSRAHLDTAGLPDPDLLIRTVGRAGISNFLLWQLAYTEFVFIPLHWPDFDKAALEAAILEYATRERRFGGLSAAEAKAG